MGKPGTPQETRGVYIYRVHACLPKAYMNFCSFHRITRRRVCIPYHGREGGVHTPEINLSLRGICRAEVSPQYLSIRDFFSIIHLLGSSSSSIIITNVVA